MELLTDTDLLGFVRSGHVDNVEEPKDWFGKDSPVQPSSLDLRIGEIFLPGVSDNDFGGADHPEHEHTLKTGETAVVTTLESLSFPSQYAGVGFPPSHISVRGLLMTNPGHVDPGYVGKMRFTVINMGRAGYFLKRGDPIVTLLIFKLPSAPHADWIKRNAKPAENPTRWQISRLSRDFVNLDSRARKISRGAVAWATVFSVVLVTIVTILGYWFPAHVQRLDELRNNVTKLQVEVDTLKKAGILLSPAGSLPTGDATGKQRK